MSKPPVPGEQASGISAGHKTFLDIKSGPRGSSSWTQAVERIRDAVEEAAGTSKTEDGWRRVAEGVADPVGALIDNLQSVMGKHPDPRGMTRYRRPDHVTPVLARSKTDTAIEGPSVGEDPDNFLDMPGGVYPGHDEQVAQLPEADESEDDSKEHPGRSYLPYIVIPQQWLGRVTRLRGRGESRSERGYFEALLILSYVVFMYRQPGRFSGDLLNLNAGAMRDLFRITQRQYVGALRYLADEGFITRILIRGLVPWDDRAKGRYTFAVPRVDKVRSLMRPRSAQGGS